MPLSSAALAMSTRSARPRTLACGAGCSSCTAAERRFGGRVPRRADRAADPVEERAMRLVLDARRSSRATDASATNSREDRA